ncbi:uncharacterized protein LOC142564987 [Dermacentor variabilis]|uniref:uncharacterized protein LOC142564987 n=1 Tax=Dermacentor variabilis TaxID=34621 RepID=UPI003F5BB0CD
MDHSRKDIMTYISSCPLTALFIVLFCWSVESVSGGANGTLSRGRRELNLPMVLNTTEPLFLYFFCTTPPRSRTCFGIQCINETNTCEHMRKISLTETTYNFTRSMLDESKEWKNTSYSAELLTERKPPIEMKYNSTEGEKVYEIDMELTYNQPDTYNCSVFTVTFTPNDTADIRTAAMYIRGGLPNGTLPPEYCQIEFMTHCSGIIYNPYNWNCSVSEPAGEVEEQNEKKTSK